MSLVSGNPSDLMNISKSWMYSLAQLWTYSENLSHSLEYHSFMTWSFGGINVILTHIHFIVFLDHVIKHKTKGRNRVSLPLSLLLFSSIEMFRIQNWSFKKKVLISLTVYKLCKSTTHFTLMFRKVLLNKFKCNNMGK